MKFFSSILLLASVVTVYAQSGYESKDVCDMICPDKCAGEGGSGGTCVAGAKGPTGAQLYDCYCVKQAPA